VFSDDHWIGQVTVSTSALGWMRLRSGPLISGATIATECRKRLNGSSPRCRFPIANERKMQFRPARQRQHRMGPPGRRDIQPRDRFVAGHDVALIACADGA
jgi:hypothetical protein